MAAALGRGVAWLAVLLMPGLALAQFSVLDIRLEGITLQPAAPRAGDEVSVVYHGHASPNCLPTERDLSLSQTDTFRFELRLVVERDSCNGAGQPFQITASLGTPAAGSYTAQASALWRIGGRSVNSASTTQLFQVAPADAAAAVTIGSTVWYDPKRSGQGVYLQQDGRSIAGTWFFYDAEDDDGTGIGPGTWLTFAGRLEGATLNAQLLRYSGPPLDVAWEQGQVQNRAAGTLTLDLLTADQVKFYYGMDGVTGSLDLVRFIPEAAGQLYSKVWFVPEESGRGWHILQNGRRLVGVWYYYDAAGRARWANMVGGLLDQRNTARLTLLRFSGPGFASADWDPERVTAAEIGRAEIAFISPGSARFDYTISVGAKTVSGTKLLQPFSLP